MGLNSRSNKAHDLLAEESRNIVDVVVFSIGLIDIVGYILVRGVRDFEIKDVAQNWSKRGEFYVCLNGPYEHP